MQNHVTKCIEESTKHTISIKNRGKAAGKLTIRQIGHGSLLIMLSKSFINKLMNIIGSMARDIISKDLCDTVLFGVMVDSIQDVYVINRLAIYLHYVVKRNIQERFFFDFSCSRWFIWTCFI